MRFFMARRRSPLGMASPTPASKFESALVDLEKVIDMCFLGAFRASRARKARGLQKLLVDHESWSAHSLPDWKCVLKRA